MKSKTIEYLFLCKSNLGIVFFFGSAIFFGMKTKYISPTGKAELQPIDFPSFNGIYDDDTIVDVYVEFATYFTVIQMNRGGWQRNGESNYFRSEHLTLEAARKAAKIRFSDPSIKEPECLIYAVMFYDRTPIGSSRPVEGYPKISSAYDRDARLAKRNLKKAQVLPKSMRNMPVPGTLLPSERYFERPRTSEEIKAALDATNIVGKGGNMAAIRFKNRRSGKK
jgi:hypothetical protein